MANDHADILTAFDGELVLDPDRTFSIRDPKWGHPGIHETWETGLELYGFTPLYQPFATIQEKRDAYSGFDMTLYFPPLEGDLVNKAVYEAPGCPEEPDAPLVPVYVYEPKKLEGKKNRKVIFEIAGGAIIFCEPEVSGLDREAVDFNCVVVGPKYRTSLEAPYPAAVNDLHAAYQWMVANADMLGIDIDSVILRGGSSGAGLAVALPFRLKRYDWCGGPMPRGIVAGNPITDDREIYPCSEICAGFVPGAETEPKGFDAINYHTAYRMWLGYNYGSYRVGPEALANHATVEDCIGYPPCVMYTDEYDPDRDYNREFAGKLMAAHSFCDYHSYGGACHGRRQTDPVIGEPIMRMANEAVHMFWDYDLRRPWVVDEYKERLRNKFGM